MTGSLAPSEPITRRTPTPSDDRLAALPHTPDCGNVMPIGNSPTFLSWEDMKRVAPIYLNMSIKVHSDPEANRVSWAPEEVYFEYIRTSLTMICQVGDMIVSSPCIYLHTTSTAFVARCRSLLLPSWFMLD